MKTKFLRVFALFASVLVLVSCLIVPMSADSFDSSKPLVESDWQYVTKITVTDLSRFNDGNLDFTLDTIQPVYVIFNVNGDRYSIFGQSVSTITDGALEVIADSSIDGFGYPLIGYYFADHLLFGETANEVYSFKREYPVVREFELVMYHNTAFIDFDYDADYISVETYVVEPASNRITSVFTNIMGWITSGLNSVQGVFYANDQLTILGTLAVIGVAVGVAFLIIGVVQKFLRLRS